MYSTFSPIFSTLCTTTQKRFVSSSLCESFYNEEQRELQRTTKKLIETEINPYVEQWEREQIFPAKEVFKAFGQAGLLGINKPQAQVIPLLLILGLALDKKF